MTTGRNSFYYTTDMDINLFWFSAIALIIAGPLVILVSNYYEATGLFTMYYQRKRQLRINVVGLSCYVMKLTFQNIDGRDYWYTDGFSKSDIPKKTATVGTNEDANYIQNKRYTLPSLSVRVDSCNSNPHAISAYIRKYLIQKAFHSIATGSKILNVGGVIGTDYGSNVMNTVVDLDPRDGPRNMGLEARLRGKKRVVNVTSDMLETVNGNFDTMVFSHSVYDILPEVVFSKAYQLGIKEIFIIMHYPAEILEGSTYGIMENSLFCYNKYAESLVFTHIQETSAPYVHDFELIKYWMQLGQVKVRGCAEHKEMMTYKLIYPEECEHITTIYPKKDENESSDIDASCLDKGQQFKSKSHDEVEEYMRKKPRGEMALYYDEDRSMVFREIVFYYYVAIICHCEMLLAVLLRHVEGLIYTTISVNDNSDTNKERSEVHKNDEIKGHIDVCKDCVSMCCKQGIVYNYNRDFIEDCGGIVLMKFSISEPGSTVRGKTFSPKTGSTELCFTEGSHRRKMVISSEYYLRVMGMLFSSKERNRSLISSEASYHSSSRLLQSVLHNKNPYETGEAASYHSRICKIIAVHIGLLPERYENISNVTVSENINEIYIRTIIMSLTVSPGISGNLAFFRSVLEHPVKGNPNIGLGGPGKNGDILDFSDTSCRMYVCGKNGMKGKPQCAICCDESIEKLITDDRVVIIGSSFYSCFGNVSKAELYISILASGKYVTVNSDALVGKVQSTPQLVVHDFLYNLGTPFNVLKKLPFDYSIVNDEMDTFRVNIKTVPYRATIITSYGYWQGEGSHGLCLVYKRGFWVYLNCHLDDSFKYILGRLKSVNPIFFKDVTLSAPNTKPKVTKTT